MMRQKSVLLLLPLLILYGVLTIGSAFSESLTFDEVVNLNEGYANLVKKQFVVEPYNPPLIREMAAFPVAIGVTISNPYSSIHSLFSRLVIVTLGAMLICAVFLFVLKRFGGMAAFLSTLFLVLDPTFLAHSHYVTPDVGLTTFLFLAWISFLSYWEQPTKKRLFLFALLSGLSIAAKLPAALFLVLGVGVFVLLNRYKNTLSIKRILFVLMIAGGVIWSTYWFQWSPILKQNTNNDRVALQLIRYADNHNLSVISGLIKSLYTVPVPLGEFLAITKNTTMRAFQPRTDFLFGSMEKPNRFGSIAYFLLKTPLSFLMLIVLSITLLLKRKPTSEGIIILLPVTVFFCIAVLTNLPPLVRYLLPVLPFLCVFVGTILSGLTSKRMGIAIGIFSLFYAYSTLRAYPFFLSYVNELVLSPQKKILIMNDSNIDWGQGLIALAEYQKRVQAPEMNVSYFGRDFGDAYGFASPTPWGSYKNNEICLFHSMKDPIKSGMAFTAISITNWHECGYSQKPEFALSKVETVVGGSILIFPGVTQ